MSRDAKNTHLHRGGASEPFSRGHIADGVQGSEINNNNVCACSTYDISM